jgi:hypothetical protein
MWSSSKQPILEAVEVLLLEILRAAIAVVMALQVNAPEVIILHRQPGKHRFDALLDVADNAARVGLLDLVPLGPGHPHE